MFIKSNEFPGTKGLRKMNVDSNLKRPSSSSHGRRGIVLVAELRGFSNWIFQFNIITKCTEWQLSITYQDDSSTIVKATIESVYTYFIYKTVFETDKLFFFEERKTIEFSVNRTEIK